MTESAEDITVADKKGADTKGTDAPPLTEADLAAAKREYRFLKRLLLVALWVSCALALSLNLADPDLWGHVRYGQDLLADGALPATASHTFTAPDHSWVNHENIAEIVFAVGYAWVGDEGLLVAKCLLGLAILAAMAWVAHQHGVRAVTMAAFLLLVANNLTAFFPVRPQLLSFAWFTLLMLVLEQAFRGWPNIFSREDVLHGGSSTSDASIEAGEEDALDEQIEVNEVREPAGDPPTWSPLQLKWLLLAAPIIALWTNSHGAFVAGVVIFGTYLGGRAVEAIYYRRWNGLPIVAALTGLGVVAIAATLINPYGIGLHEWLLASLGSPRPEITEWAAPKPSDPVFWPFVTLMVVATASWFFTQLRRDWVQIVIVGLVAWQACSHLRHIAFFTLLCGFWLPPHLQSALRRLRPDTLNKLPVQRIGIWSRWGFAGALAVAIGLQSHALYGRLERLPVYRNMYPVDAVQWMTFKGVKGKLVVSFNWAQYAIAALAPETKVSFDGRFRTCYPQEVVDMNFDFLLGEHEGRRHRQAGAGPIDPTAVLEYRKPDLVLVDRTYEHSVSVMLNESEKADPEWSLIYQDGIAQLWGRCSVYDDPNSQRYVAAEERLITDRVYNTAFAWPALPHPSVTNSVAEGPVAEDDSQATGEM